MSNAELSASERKAYRRVLSAVVARTAGGVAELEASALRVPADRTDPTPLTDEVDPAVRESEEELARTLLESRGDLLAEARAALERLDAGTFGKCETCGRQISRARLDVVPYARTCARCARAAEGAAGDAAE